MRRLHRLAEAVGLSPSRFSQAFKKTTGKTPLQWQQERRIDPVKRALLSSKMMIADVSMQVGFADQAHLTRGGAATRARRLRPGCAPGAAADPGHRPTAGAFGSPGLAQRQRKRAARGVVVGRAGPHHMLAVQQVADMQLQRRRFRQPMAERGIKPRRRLAFAAVLRVERIAAEMARPRPGVTSPRAPLPASVDLPQSAAPCPQSRRACAGCPSPRRWPCRNRSRSASTPRSARSSPPDRSRAPGSCRSSRARSRRSDPVGAAAAGLSGGGRAARALAGGGVRQARAGSPGR
ncbi:helix-turn-helix transcriptional regulator [Rhodobacter capsulatus]|uniref:Helix-turn-helix transcriptional regulator n=1 Tax=Rhodobacter capsulatus TaxID=1061 RepID=A0A4U1JRS3_RHOCA|nr:helix-turn-helix transcriptional regulator [Rhodobacter capsulatus]